ncbi:polyprenyl synthetase family protein [Geoglobus acetivorans]|uniref:Polyprenyl synthetase n=1 Tax=Geoglobus acetivorans TaxID=565033 RepID=A0A0A7GFK3_GEOAI|nr:polyprenyl synthetase [Geoglobus acetivorans]
MIESWEEYRVINDALNRLVNNLETLPKVKRAIEHLIRAGGKRTRPLVVLLSAKLAGGKYEDVIDMAMAVELIHTASLAHDDIIDRGVVRRNVETLNVKYDPSLAMLVGDWLISKSVELTSRYGHEIVRNFARTGMVMSEGEILDVYSLTDDFSRDDYFRCIESKTASLFAFSARNAYKFVSGDSEGADRLFQYGLNLGIAYQLVDDLLEFLEIFEEKKSEFESMTLPVILEARVGFRNAVDEVLELIRKFTGMSKDALKTFPSCDAKEKLLQLVDYMTVNMIRNYVTKNREIISLLEAHNI